MSDKEKKELEAGWEKLKEEQEAFEKTKEAFVGIKKELEAKAAKEQKVINSNPKTVKLVAKGEEKEETVKVKVKAKFGIGNVTVIPGDTVELTKERAKALKGTLVE